MNLPSCFVTGTDTDAGKTVVTASLLRYLAKQNVSSAGLKPIASGFSEVDGCLVNDDIEALSKASLVKLPKTLVNVYGFEPAIAPHIAAQDAGVELIFSAIEASINRASKLVDVVLVEGVGGWRVPLSSCGSACASPCLEHANTIGALAQVLKLPVILVVGLKLGCLNHALLTAQAIIDDGLNLLGWVANNVQSDFARQAENVATLKQLMPAPMLFELPHLTDSLQRSAFVPKMLNI